MCVFFGSMAWISVAAASALAAVTVPDDDELIDDAAIIAELDSKQENGTYLPAEPARISHWLFVARRAWLHSHHEHARPVLRACCPDRADVEDIR